MHTYKKYSHDKWEVGYYIMEINYNAVGGGGGSWPPIGAGGGQIINYPVTSTWITLSEHDTEQSAAARVNYLNGGPTKDTLGRTA